MKKSLMLAALMLATVACTVTACTTARFAPTPPQAQATPQQQPPSRYRAPTGGPYERTPEGRQRALQPAREAMTMTDEQ
jgi:hypothetical protein